MTRVFSALICYVLARSTKYRPDGSCGVQNISEECPGTTCIQRLFDEDNCMTCECDHTKNRMGDMVLSTEAISFIIDGNLDGRAKGADPTLSLWNTIQEGGKFVIPYSLSSDLTPPFIDAINAALSEIQAKCCFTFRKRTTESDYMFFFRGAGCSANVGRWSGENRVSIGQGCETKGIVIHEVMHNLGFFHEHQRPDRNTYVKVLTDNISPDSQDQYQIITNIDSKESPYDYGSIMHYFGDAFAMDKTKPTMTFANGSALTGIQDLEMSVYDAQQLTALYNCPAPADNTTVAATTTATSTATTTTTTPSTNTTTSDVNITTTSSNVTTTGAVLSTTSADVATSAVVTTTSAAVTTTIAAATTTSAVLRTTSASVNTTVPNPACVDHDHQCSLWAGMELCDNPKYTAIAKICPLSCRICTEAEPCFDEFGSELCSEWKYFCPYNKLVRTQCKKSCDLC